MTITTYTLPAAVSRPLLLAQVADLHDRPTEPVLTALQKRRPDLIAVTGDLFHSLADSRYAQPFLQQAAAIAPTFLSLGNHEHLVPGDVTRITETGAVLLDNTATRFDTLAVGGLTSGFGERRQGNWKGTPPPDTAFLDRFAAMPGCKLLLCHHPEYYMRYIRPLAIDLTLAGHAHGGQWRLFGQGVFAPGQGLFPRYTGGVYDGRLIVSRGLANTAPVPRLFNPTELVYVQLVPAE